MGNKSIHRDIAAATARLLAQRGITLVYGGGNVGLMGVIADEALAAGGKVIGVIPRFLADKEVAHRNLSELHLVDTMHERKALMASLSEGFLALPGGYGTLDEFCEILTWGQLNLHHRPMGILNAAGYYDSLLKFFDEAVADGFLTSKLREMVLAADSPEAILDLMAQHVKA